MYGFDFCWHWSWCRGLASRPRNGSKYCWSCGLFKHAGGLSFSTSGYWWRSSVGFARRSVMTRTYSKPFQPSTFMAGVTYSLRSFTHVSCPLSGTACPLSGTALRVEGSFVRYRMLPNPPGPDDVRVFLDVSRTLGTGLISATGSPSPSSRLPSVIGTQ